MSGPEIPVLAKTEGEEISVKVLYDQLKARAEEYKDRFQLIDFCERIKGGILEGHSDVILYLYRMHLFLNDKQLYDRLKSCEDEASARQLLGGKVMTTYVQGIKTITLYTDLFPQDFIEIIYAYIQMTDS